MADESIRLRFDIDVNLKVGDTVTFAPPMTYRPHMTVLGPGRGITVRCSWTDSHGGYREEEFRPGGLLKLDPSGAEVPVKGTEVNPPPLEQALQCDANGSRHIFYRPRRDGEEYKVEYTIPESAVASSD